MVMTKELLPGMKIWRFSLQRRLAQGGMGTVWAAWDERLDREVALKLLPRVLLTEPSAEARFEREALAMARLQHPNVVSIYDIGTFDPGVGEELPYLVMELIRGSSLNEMLAEGALPARLAARIVEQVSLALSAAHRVGVIHRDLKPSNIMVGDGGHVTVLDFGLARLAHREGETPVETLTSPGMVLGSCPYMAPEQALGQGVTQSSDIFSCGAVLYECLSGTRAFDGPTPMKVLQAVVRSEYPPLRDVAPAVPSELAAVVERCLEREPGRRYRTCADLAHDLAVFQGTDAVSLAEAPTVTLGSGKLEAVVTRRRRLAIRGAAIAGTTLLLGLAAGVLGGRFGWEPQRPDPGRWEARALMDTVGTLVDPSWRPDGSEIVVARNQIGTGEILAVDPTNGNARTLLEAVPPEILGSPRVSPDGKAMLVEVVVAGEPSIRVFPAVGGRATTEVINAGGATWVDADSFLFSREEAGGGSGLFMYSIGRRETTRVREAESDLSWLSALPRPGGGFALLSGSSGIPSGLFVAKEAGATPRIWQPPDKQIFGVSWAPSGRSLVASIEGRLVRITADGTAPVIPRIDRLWHPAFSPSADRLAVVRKSSTNDLIAVDPDGGGWTCLLCGVADSGWGSVDADGVVVYRRYMAGSATLFLRDPSGVEVAVSDPAEDASCPLVSPDGSRIAYLARVPEGGTELRVVSRSGGQPVTLADSVESSEYPSWSPDGRFIAFSAGSPIRVFVVPASGGEPRELTPDGGDYPQWSPAGGWIAYSVWTQDSDPAQGAWVVDANGGTPLKIGREPTRLVWSRDGGLLWQLRRADDAIELWEAEAGLWTWKLRSTLDLGRPAASHLEHLPLTVNPATGELVMNRRTSLASLLVFEGVDPTRW
jgi:Tol biopolymer transport system component